MYELLVLLTAMFVVLLVMAVNIYYDSKEFLKVLRGIRADLRTLKTQTNGGEEK